MTPLDAAVAAGDRVTGLALPPETIGIAAEVLQELKHPWGIERMPDGTGHDRAMVYVAALQRMQANKLGNGLSWARVLLEVAATTLNEQPGSPELRHALIELSAVAQRWVRDIDRRNQEIPPSPLRWGAGRGLTA